MHASTETIERLIVGKLVDGLVGHFDNIEVTDAEGTVLIKDNDNSRAVVGAIFSGVGDIIEITCEAHNENYWIRLVLGNGVNIISDYSVNLQDEELLHKAEALAAALEA